MTREEFENINFKFQSHVAMREMNYTTYISEDGTIRVCVRQPMNPDTMQPCRRASRHYMWRGMVYKQLDKLLEAMNDE